MQPGPPRVAPRELGILEQTPFSADDHARELAAAQQRRLESYGWVDPAAGTIHIPIEQAMQLVVMESQK